eukprot:5708504-Alexandrium_andersonii.AAC.1
MASEKLAKALKAGLPKADIDRCCSEQRGLLIEVADPSVPCTADLERHESVLVELIKISPTK